MREKEIITFTIEGCRYCEELEKKLDKEGIKYKNIDVSTNNEIGDMIEGNYKCNRYPMVVLHSPDRSIIWLPETELLPSINIKIYDSINQIIIELKNEFNS
jgi:glutaredoxin